MTTKRKSERSLEATRKYNEYMRSWYKKKKEAEGKVYIPRDSRDKSEQEIKEVRATEATAGVIEQALKRRKQ